MPPNVIGDPEVRPQWRTSSELAADVGWGAYPKNRDPGVLATVDGWLEARTDIEGAEGLWRVDNGLYDLTGFVQQHPGGAEWLNLTKGTDVTEQFYTHHVSEAAENILPKYFVRRATTPRNSPYTFQRDGFYMQLRSRIRQRLSDLPKEELQRARARSCRIADSLAASAVLTCGLAGALDSYLLGTVGGLLLSLTAGCAHNFFHQKHNWRRYYFDLSLMSSREWLISHAMSHHMFPNSIMDLEVTFFEPAMQFLPDPGKSFVTRYLSWAYAILLYAGIAHVQFLKRLRNLRKSDAIALAVPAAMLLMGTSLTRAWLMWTWVLVVSGFYLAYQGLSAGHHHPRNYHEGDATREDKDFGLMQLDTTVYCTGFRGRDSLFLCITHFGDHRLHHLFPALDHAVLPLLDDTYTQHLLQSGVPNNSITSWEALKGFYLQLANNKPNSVPRGHQHQQ